MVDRVPPSAIENWGKTDEKPREVGPIEQAVEGDLALMGQLTRPGQATLAAMARKLARALDARGDEESPSQTAKAIETLRTTMAQITTREAHNPDDADSLGKILGTPDVGGLAGAAPVRNTTQPGEANPRRRGRPPKRRDG